MLMVNCSNRASQHHLVTECEVNLCYILRQCWGILFWEFQFQLFFVLFFSSFSMNGYKYLLLFLLLFVVFVGLYTRYGSHYINFRSSNRLRVIFFFNLNHHSQPQNIYKIHTYIHSYLEYIYRRKCTHVDIHVLKAIFDITITIVRKIIDKFFEIIIS